MKKNKFNEERLLHYARHLKKGKVMCGDMYEKLTQLHAGQKIKNDKSLQPIYFLPIMELPMIFPNDWHYDECFLPVYKHNQDQETVASIIEYFSLNKYLFIHLFVKGKQRVEIWGGNELSVHPTFEDIGNNIEEMVEHLNYYANINGNEFQIFLN